MEMKSKQFSRQKVANKSYLVSFRINEKEAVKLDELAFSEKMSINNFIKRLALNRIDE